MLLWFLIVMDKSQMVHFQQVEVVDPYLKRRDYPTPSAVHR